MKYSFVFNKLGKDSASAASPQQNHNAASSNLVSGTVTSAAGMSVAETDAELAADFVCSERFSERFWSTDERCISVLMHKLKAAKQTTADILQLVATRAAIEEELGKKLGKLARAGLGSEEVNTLKEALRTVRAETDCAARTHAELARQLRAEVEKPLGQFMGDQRIKRRAQTALVQRTEGERSALRTQLRKLQERRRADTKRVGDLDLQVNGLQGTADPKLRAKLDRAQTALRATEAEYVDVRARLKDADAQWYNVWRAACDVFQVLEEQRIEYLKTALWTYANLVSASCVADDEALERIRQDLERVSVAADISAFIHTFGTGSPDPAIMPRRDSATRDADADDSDGGSAHPLKSPREPPQRQQQHPPPQSAMARPATSTAANPSPNPNPNHNPNLVARASTPSSIGPAQTFGSFSSAHSGTARSAGSQRVAAPQYARPASMHNNTSSSQQQQQPLAAQAHQLLNGSANWNSRPASSVQGSVSSSSHSYRRASNSDMYAMASASTSSSSPAGNPPLDPRAPSSMGAVIPNQHMAAPQPPHLGSPRSRASTYNGAGPQGQNQIQNHNHNQQMLSGATFGTLTANSAMMIPPQQQQQHPSSAPGSPSYHHHHHQPQYIYHHHHSNSSGNANTNAAARPMSSAGMHSMAAPSPQMQVGGARPGSVMANAASTPVAAPYADMYNRSATPVQQIPSRPPTQAAYYPQQQQPPPPPVMVANNNNPMLAPSPQMLHYHQQQQQPQQIHHLQQQQLHQRAPSVMAVNSNSHNPQAVSSSPSSRLEPGTSESGKEILFYVKVLYDYDAENDKELTIREGEVISVLAVSADGWWEGEMTDRRTGRPLHGTFPSNFTDPIANLA